MASVKRISGNELSELREMYARVLSVMERDFLHVTEHIPAKVLNDVKKAAAAADAEYDKRIELMYG